MKFSENTEAMLKLRGMYEQSERDRTAIAGEVFFLRMQLAEGQAREKMLRDALKMQPRNLRTVWKDGIDLNLPDRITERRDEALAMPVNDTALKAALASERERCIAAIRNRTKRFIISDFGSDTPVEDDCIAAIRALGDD